MGEATEEEVGRGRGRGWVGYHIFSMIIIFF